jgi:putative SbcD/Mre11-related phosphoesterase
MAQVEPVLDARAATAEIPEGTALVLADYHAGIEAALRLEGVELRDASEQRRSRVLELLEESNADRLVVLGDLAHFVGAPMGDELAELEALLDALPVPLTLVPGNHDGAVAERLDIDVEDSHGIRLGDVGFVHGHTWPAPDVLEADVICSGHEHVAVRLVDEVGGSQIEPGWLRGPLDSAAFTDRPDYEGIDIHGEMIVFPAFNERSGGTQVNVSEQDFLSPFLPQGLEGGQVYLLDGTHLGDFEAV